VSLVIPLRDAKRDTDFKSKKLGCSLLELGFGKDYKSLHYYNKPAGRL